MAKGAKANDDEKDGARQEWATPGLLFDNLNADFKFTVDACAEKHNAKLPRFWSPQDNGLAQKWEGERVWCNPPYNDIMPWLSRGWTAALRDPTSLSVHLLPARTDSAWWHTFAMRTQADFFRGRIQFEIPEAVREALREKAETLEEALANLHSTVGTKDPQAKAAEKEIAKLKKQAEGASSNAEGSALIIISQQFMGENDLPKFASRARDPLTGKYIQLEPIQAALPFTQPEPTTSKAPCYPPCLYCGEIEPLTKVWSSLVNGSIHDTCRDEVMEMLAGMSPAKRRETEAVLRASSQA